MGWPGARLVRVLPDSVLGPPVLIVALCWVHQGMCACGTCAYPYRRHLQHRLVDRMGRAGLLQLQGTAREAILDACLDRLHSSALVVSTVRMGSSYIPGPSTGVFCRLAKQHKCQSFAVKNAVSFQKCRFDVFTKVTKLAVGKGRRLVGESRRLVGKSRRFKTLTYHRKHGNAKSASVCFST